MHLERDGTLQGKVPFEDLGVLVLAHPGISITQRALNGAMEAGAVVVLCDNRYLPSATFLPMADNTLHAKVLREQVRWGKGTQKRIWRQVVAAKIAGQASLLESLGKANKRLARLAKTMPKTGSVYLEGYAAEIYWRCLFGPDFKRDRFAEGVNSWLNYGYAIMRGAMARAICSAGLHPALGVFHRNQYNAYALADDLMEPLRPMVDRKVVALAQDFTDPALDRQKRVPLLELLAQPVMLEEASFPLMVALERYVQSVRKMGNNLTPRLEIPR